MNLKMFNEWMSSRDTLQKYIYLLVQLLILIIPPVWATFAFQINLFVTNPYEKFLVYLGGFSGIFIAGIPAELLAKIISITASSILFSFIYILFAVACFIRYYSTSNRQLLKVSLVNGYLAIWSVVFGNVFLFLAMQ